MFDRVTAVGAEALCETIPQIAAGTLTAVPQDHENATLAPMLNKEMAEFHLTDTATHIHNWVRGMNPWPGAWFSTSGGKKLKVMSCRVATAHGEAPGTVLGTKPLTVACSEGAIQLLEVVPEGKKPMDGTAFAAGRRLKRGIASDGRKSACGGSRRTGTAGAGRFSNLVLDAELKRQKLEGRDKAFASAIFYTVLEHRGTLDYILEQFLPKGLAKLDAPVREILRAALAQARYMQVPVSAAVNEAVKLTRTFKKSSASGLVNAVLRKACGYDLDAAVFTGEIQRLMVLGSAGLDVAKFSTKLPG